MKCIFIENYDIISYKDFLILDICIKNFIIYIKNYQKKSSKYININQYEYCLLKIHNI